MVRFLQLSVLIVILLVARHIIYRWLRQRESLGELIGRGVTVVVAYLVYVMAGMVALSWVAGRGFGADNTPIAVLIVLGAAAYVGLGVAGLWWFLRQDDQQAAGRKSGRPK